jgi:16S rRNA pseudouridine516 synthase
LVSQLRLDRLLANLGYATRTEAASLIRSGRVSVDHTVARDPSARVTPSAVRLDDESLDHPTGVLVALHKPVGYVCSHDDRDGPTVYTLLPRRWLDRTPRPEAVGRLDKDATGLLLVTDDHALLHRLTSPKHHVAKTYRVALDRRVDPSLVVVFADGDLVLRGETTPCLPAELVLTGDRLAELTITEGRYHQVKRMFAACGYHVDALHRTRVGDWLLGDLPEGTWRDRAAV